MEDKKEKSAYEIVVGISVVIVAIFFVRVLCDGLNIWHQGVNYEITGQVGDFIGGVIGTIFSAAGFYLLYRTLKEQRLAINNQKDSFEKERFESKFFDLIKLHRENVSDQNYTKFGQTKFDTANGRKVFRIINKEFETCYKEIKRFYRIYAGDFILEKHKLKLEQLKSEHKLTFEIEEIAFIDIAYCIVYFGVGRESETYLFNKFRNRYSNEFYYKLIKYIQLKPKKENIQEYLAWQKFHTSNILLSGPIFKYIYLNRRNKNFVCLIDNVDITGNYHLDKYYGGHQHRLGHYFRHLFQSYKYLENQENLKKMEKYYYGKTLRAQMSTYEQSLLFINSVSSLGMKWELDGELNVKKKSLKLISDYNLIKNVPGRKLLDISYKKYYPRVKYEFED